MLLKLLAGNFKGTSYLGSCSVRHLKVLSFEMDLAEKIGINRKVFIIEREEEIFTKFKITAVIGK
jgi:hypothetical protein